MKLELGEIKRFRVTSLVLSLAGAFTILQALYLDDWLYFATGISSFLLGWIIRSVHYEVDHQLEAYSWPQGTLFFRGVPIREGDHPYFNSKFWDYWISIEEAE